MSCLRPAARQRAPASAHLLSTKSTKLWAWLQKGRRIVFELAAPWVLWVLSTDIRLGKPPEGHNMKTCGHQTSWVPVGILEKTSHKGGVAPNKKTNRGGELWKKITQYPFLLDIEDWLFHSRLTGAPQGARVRYEWSRWELPSFLWLL